MDGMFGRVREALVRRLTVDWFPFFQRRGIHVTRDHYYSPVPNASTIAPAVWDRRSQLIGIDLAELGQIALLDACVEQFKGEYDRIPLLPTPSSHEYYLQNYSFGPVDGEMLFCMIRQHRPRRVIEIGSGFSTLLSAQALRANGDGGELIAIEPYPSQVLRTGVAGLTTLFESRVQDIPLELFASLGMNDILFIDSSHVLKLDSDVKYEYLEILPRLRPGVIVHFHDIFLPAEYPKHWFTRERRFWNEQYLLQAFLAFNRQFDVLWAASYMHLTHPTMLESAFGSYKSTAEWPGSFWVRRR